MSKIVEPCPMNSSMGVHACKNRHQCWEPCGELGHSAEHMRVAPIETQEAVNRSLGKGAQQEAVDLVQAYINTLERRIEAAKEALIGNQSRLALDILNGKQDH